MKIRTVALIVLSATAAVAAPFAGAPSVATVWESQLTIAEHDVVPLAEAMPESHYNFAPTSGDFKGVRTFSQQVKHLATVIYLASAAAQQQQPPVDLGTGENGPDSVKTKDQIVTYLKGAFAYAHKAMQSLTAANQLDVVKSPFGEIPRAQIASFAVWHTFDHYGQMVVYARMNEVIPPASK
jgi:hypothetical protein